MKVPLAVEAKRKIFDRLSPLAVCLSRHHATRVSFLVEPPLLHRRTVIDSRIHGFLFFTLRNQFCLLERTLAYDLWRSSGNMDARGHISSAYRGRVIQAPGMLRHGPPPGSAPAHTGHSPREFLFPPDQLETKISDQEAGMERLARENQRLAERNVAMRQELVNTQKELQSLQAHLGSIRTDTDIQIRGYLGKIGNFEADMRAGDAVKEELQQAHLEAQRLVTARQELTADIQLVTEELQKLSNDSKKLPVSHAELEGLIQEHQKLRATFEYEKGLNIEQIERMQGMEKNLTSMANEIERLKAEVTNAQQMINAPNRYGGTYPPASQAVTHADSLSNGVRYVDGSYDTGLGYVNTGYYSESYGRTHALVNNGTVVQGSDFYPAIGIVSSMNTYGVPHAR